VWSFGGGYGGEYEDEFV